MCTNAFTETQLQEFQRTGHITIHHLFDRSTIQSTLDDLTLWSREFLATLRLEDRPWFLEHNTQEPTLLRKLDHPAFHRDAFRKLATHSCLIPRIHQLLGSDCHLFFSQVFMKPPEAGSPKPIHQDNFYFGPDNLDATLTVWVALDDATLTNGCLHYFDCHQTEILPHFAPEDEPFNLQIAPQHFDQRRLIPAPIASGGVSFHHGNTPHFSAANQSGNSRRAVAFHYLRNDATLTNSGLDYDPAMRVFVG